MSFVGPVNVLSSTRAFPAAQSLAQSESLFLRPHDVVISTTAAADMAAATVQRVIYLGWEVQVELTLEDGQQVMSYVSRGYFDQLKLVPQQRVYVKPKKAKSFALQPA